MFKVGDYAWVAWDVNVLPKTCPHCESDISRWMGETTR